MISSPGLQDDQERAIRGEVVPRLLDDNVTRASLIRGIRLHYDFAMSKAVTHLSTSMPSVARARNARRIMSNDIPERMEEVEQPYCIWYPDLASEETYRNLASRFPNMRYQVGRACAVAGHHALYQELHLLPDVSIAEEARESEEKGGKLIYDEIMSAQFRYAVMNDCQREIEAEFCKSPAYLNGDTEVRWRLTARQSCVSQHLQDLLPCIEEDMHLDLEKRELEERYAKLSDDEAKLLYQPLPRDLPTIKKTLLIQMAAYDGNIDRFARLAGSGRTLSEMDLDCVTRGILHHSMFSRWWADQAEFEKGWPPGVPMPYIIWWPLRPAPEMLMFLSEKVPEMKMQAAAAAIVCDYETAYSFIKAEPSWHLWKVSMFSPNTFYREDQVRRGKEKNINVEDDTNMELYYRDMMETREFTVLDPYDGKLRDSVEYYEVPNGYEKMLSTGDVQLKIWEGVGKVPPTTVGSNQSSGPE
ncbi:hypothetical protein NW762_012043 [Fusarium torreyae]|uniref:Uncharacterized protein n=1 Tax=Fusarium torreyae TaxID=1237075 RepID=A0A9W8VA31_9HYPO|nr:hypothetical protein NW762_012043 [Fusarium torreyae]